MQLILKYIYLLMVKSKFFNLGIPLSQFSLKKERHIPIVRN